MLAYVCVWLDGPISSDTRNNHSFGKIKQNYASLLRTQHTDVRLFTCGSKEFADQGRLIDNMSLHVDPGSLLTDDKISRFARALAQSDTTFTAMLIDILRFRLMHYVLRNFAVTGVLWIDTHTVLSYLSTKFPRRCLGLQSVKQSDASVLYANTTVPLREFINYQARLFECIRFADPTVLVRRMSAFVKHTGLREKYSGAYPEGNSLETIMHDYRVHSRFLSTVSPLADLLLCITSHYVGGRALSAFMRTHSEMLGAIDCDVVTLGPYDEYRHATADTLLNRYMSVVSCVYDVFGTDAEKMRELEEDMAAVGLMLE